MEKDIRILLVDDHQVVRDGLCSMLAEETDMEVVGQSAGGEDALLQIDKLSPNIILMDIKMPQMDGIQLANLVRQKNPGCNIIMLTLYDEYLVRAMGAGAKGYLLKDITREDLIQAIRHVHSGEVVIGKSIAAKPGNHNDQSKADDHDRSLPKPDHPDTLLEEIQLIIPPPAGANQVIRFITKVEKALHTRILQVAGSWDEGTAITAILPRAMPLAEILGNLREINGIETVEEAPPEWGKAPGLIKKALPVSGRKNSTRKALFINFKNKAAESAVFMDYRRLHMLECKR